MGLRVSNEISRYAKIALTILGTIGFFSNGSRLLAQNAPIPFVETNNWVPANARTQVEILSDTRGIESLHPM
jgi:hypothetical protein